MKAKRFIAISSVILFFIVVWFSHNRYYIRFSTLDSLLWMNNSASGYSSIQAYTLIYSIPFLIFLNHIFFPDSLVTIVRSTKRVMAYRKISMQIIIAAFLFSTLHMLVNLLFTSLFMDWDLLKETKFFFACFVNMIALTLFYTSIGIIYRYIYDLNPSSGIAIFLSYLAVGILFFIEKLFIPPGIWEPLKDLVVLPYFLEGKWMTSILTFVYLRQLVIITVCYLVGSSVFLRKDFI
ncbi:WxPxxD family membrane protein [Priestia megaterium]|uniref:WxPxxD family membrane protein n=1 Tax=Priestia TaxID=2800373 RepID=UPI0036772B0E